MIEREMEYRGSKSVEDYACPTVSQLSSTVKEQRVDGSCIGYFKITAGDPMLRYTLMGLERDYQVKIPSKQIIQLKRYYSTRSSDKSILNTLDMMLESSQLENWFVTGFVDAEGCFCISVRKKSSSWYCEPKFEISLHKNDLEVLQRIQAHFEGKGSIIKHGKESFLYVITSTKEIFDVVIPHFDKYPLKTQKLADYLLFREAVELIRNKKHLTDEGLRKIVGLKASLNLGLSDELKTAFPDTMVVSRPLVINQEISNPHWLQGFTCGEGCFLIKVSKSKGSKLGYGVQLIFQLTQHIRDIELMESLVTFFGCGRIVQDLNYSRVNFIVSKFSDIIDKVLPFFNQYPVIGIKNENFKDWSIAAEIMKNQGHLTEEGLNKILKIKAGMNRGRAKSSMLE